MNTYEVFVQGGPSVKTSKFKIPRGMLEYAVGMGGKVVDEVGHPHIDNQYTLYITCSLHLHQ